ncbi:MAG: hypothetical protein G01um101416_155 [Microgenomates group bacterium Gr01-1014_16]|nr:MAG: hypothetical protein G01um101416_155 [Microgenomates group bacterium Gr01-1014_16]
MDTEFEVKFYPVDKLALQRKLVSLGAKLVSPERKMRRVIYDQVIHPEFKCGFLRIRDEGSKITMSTKSHSKTGKIEDEKEIEIVISNYDKAVEILKLVNLEPDKYQETLRESWELDSCHIDIDTWPGLDTYCEIESDSEIKIKSLSEKLGFDWTQHLISNSMDMLIDTYQLSVKKTLALASNLTFENNPFANLPKKGRVKSKSIGL